MGAWLLPFGGSMMALVAFGAWTLYHRQTGRWGWYRPVHRVRHPGPKARERQVPGLVGRTRVAGRPPWDVIGALDWADQQTGAWLPPVTADEDETWAGRLAESVQAMPPGLPAPDLERGKVQSAGSHGNPRVGVDAAARLTGLVAAGNDPSGSRLSFQGSGAGDESEACGLPAPPAPGSRLLRTTGEIMRADLLADVCADIARRDAEVGVWLAEFRQRWVTA